VTDRPTLHISCTRKPGSAFGVQWLVDVPWAHPVWRQYAFFLHDLTSDLGRPPLLYAEGVTHELVVFAVDPTKRQITDLRHRPDAWLLQPPNHAYQFAAANDAEAEARIATLVRRVEQRTLSPDTDFRPEWDRLFADGVSLLVGANRPRDGVYQ
jgi:hypothetical protein